MHERPAEHRLFGKDRYVSGYLNAGQPTPAIGLGVYGVVAACSRATGAALAAGFGAGFAAAGFFTAFAAGGFFAAFFGALFFFAGFAMPRNLPHAPGRVKRSISVTFDQ